MTLPKTPSFDLTGKRALVAGASSGIGLGCAVALAEGGAHVTLAARSVVKLETAVADMKAAGFSADALAMDVSDVAVVDHPGHVARSLVLFRQVSTLSSICKPTRARVR